MSAMHAGMHEDLDLELGTFIELKRYRRFDGLIMLILGKGLIFHTAAGSHPVQPAWGHK